MYKFDSKKVKEELVQWIKTWFSKHGLESKAVIGVSGGIDSSVVAALCVEALGKDRVLGVLLPKGEQPDINVSYDLINFLGVDYVKVDISKACDAIRDEVKSQLDDHWSQQSSINLPARIRMTTLFAIAQTVNGRVSCNCNLSEDWIGYSTFGGDDFGSFAPLIKLTKTEVKAIGKELGLPDEFVNKVPTDGLCGKSDEDNFGFTYEVLDKYIRTGEIEDKSVKSKIDSMHKKNAFKLKPMSHYSPNKNLLNTSIIRKEIYSIEEIKKATEHVLMNKDKKQSIVELDGDEIYGNSDRYKCFFTKGIKCSCCGIEGKFFAKEKTEGLGRYHLNLYAIDESGDEVLMTKDHIIPKSKGGKNQLDNYQTMCVKCNSKKGNS